MQYTLLVTGDIEQAVASVTDHDLSAIILKAHYVRNEHMTALKIDGDTDGKGVAPEEDEHLRQQLEEWKAERGTTGELKAYSPYVPQAEGVF